jgi:hypothetical protein
LRSSIYLALASAILLMAGCATESYGSFSRRTSDFGRTTLALAPGGLEKSAVDAILSTEFPPRKDVAVAILFVDRGSAYRDELNLSVMALGRSVKGVERFVPVPSIMVPDQLTFEAVQQLGIRCLAEYTLLVYSKSGTAMSFSQLIKGEYSFESDLEFSLIDNQTTAVIASDRLLSRAVKKAPALDEEAKAAAMREVFDEQAGLLKRKLDELFDPRSQ